MVLQIASPQRATFIFTSPSWESHIPVGSPAKAGLDVMASVINPRTTSGIENRVISSLSFGQSQRTPVLLVIGARTGRVSEASPHCENRRNGAALRC